MRISPVSKWLVGTQMLCIASLVWTGGLWPHSHAGRWLLLVALLLMAAAFIAFRRSRLSVFPEPVAGAQLLQQGIYAYIRHPLYTAVLLGTAAYLPGPWAWWRCLLWVLLLVILLIKIRLEERLLRNAFAEYAGYQQRTWRLLPFVY